MLSHSAAIEAFPSNAPSDGFYQIVPDRHTSTERYATDLTHYIARLNELCTNLPTEYQVEQVPYPIYSPPHRVIEMQTTCVTAQVAFSAIIKEWWSNKEFQTYIPLAPKIERVLRKLDSLRPYSHVGLFRPDILIPDSEREATKICEINARFMFNGFFMSALLSQASEELDFAEGFEGGMTVNKICRYFDSLMDKSKPVVVLIKKGLKDLHCLTLFANYYPNVRLVDPFELRLIPSPTSPSGVAVTDNIGIIEQFMLELHQDEIEALDEELLLEIGKVCWNDLRTIFLAHDKRMLGLIRKELHWLLQWGKITPEQGAILENGLAETYTPMDKMWGWVSDRTVPGEKNNWVLKKCLSGKGDGMLFGRDLDEKAWKEFLNNQNLLHMPFRRRDSAKRRSSSRKSCTGSSTTSTISSRENSDGEKTVPEPPMGQYVLQRYIKQKKLDLIVHDRRSKQLEPKKVRWCFVGSVFCINLVILPCVFWRTNSNDVIAVGRDGLAIGGLTCKGMIDEVWVPVRARDPQLAIIPSDARITAPIMKASDAEIEAVRMALAKYGLAVVETHFEDVASDYMVNLTKHLGEPLSHSSCHGILWDVKPVASIDSKNVARSETMESFPWHTDCSFEEFPPRYFALHIIHHDRYGGGKLRLVHTDSILKNLTPQIIHILQSPLFKIHVPEEFHKEINYIVGPLLSSDGQRKLRYRRDIIEPLNDEAAAALGEVERSLLLVDGAARLLGQDVMKDGCIVLLDNARWLHARSPIRDSNRWLRRVRWGPEKFF